jgi:hypothetical protein
MTTRATDDMRAEGKEYPVGQGNPVVPSDAALVDLIGALA